MPVADAESGDKLVPPVIVALGATAACAISQRAVTISQVRGRPLEKIQTGTTVFVTIRLSYLLRLRDKDFRRVK